MPKTTAQRQAWLRNVARTLDRYKVEQGCRDCGYCACPAALHFDHTDPLTKRADLGWFGDRSKLTTSVRLARFIDHVERYCVLRCANCHAERTSTERHWLVSRAADKPTTPPLPTLF